MKVSIKLAAALVPILAVGAVAAPASASDWKRAPVVPSISGAVKRAFDKDLERSRESGMRSRVFAKIGDSNTEMSSALYGLGCRRPHLYGRRWLRPVIHRYRQVTLANDRALPGCRTGNSFSRRSAAAQAGTFTTWSLSRIDTLPETGYWSPPSDCLAEETPLSCEFRFTRPRYSLIMIGTNDVDFDSYLGIRPGSQTVDRMTQLITAVRAMGSVPLVSTLPPLLTVDAGPGAINPYNAAIARAARRNSVPLINLWRALKQRGVVNSGMEDGGLHLRDVAGGESPTTSPGPTTITASVNFSPAGLTVGSNLRNLIWLKTLAALDRASLKS